MAGRYDPNPGRWVCEKKLDRCDGTRRLYTEKVPCPLAGKCVDDPRNHREFPLTRYGTRGIFLELHDPEWRKRHNDKRLELLRAFTPNYDKKWKADCRARAGATWRANYRRKRHEEYWKRDAARKAELPSDFGRGARHLLLPCGEDHRNCPYDGICRYTDEDEDRLFKFERQKLKEENKNG